MVPATVRWVLLALALSVPAASGDDVLEKVAWDAPFATPAWSRTLQTESLVFAVHVEGPGSVAVRATGTTGVQLHGFSDASGALMRQPRGLDLVPSAVKERQLGPGDWLVAVDPSAPADRIGVEFRGAVGRDRVHVLGPWTCPFDPRAGCMP